MTEEDYLEQRVNDQINWYDRKSSYNKKMFMRLRATEIILALIIPFLTGYVDLHTDLFTMLIGLSGIVVAAIASVMTLYRYQENWIEYRTYAEALKYEKFLYLTKAGIYREQLSFPYFVERIEAILSKENAKWSSQNLTQKEEEAPVENPVT